MMQTQMTSVQTNRKLVGLLSGTWPPYMVFTSEKYSPFFDTVYVGDFGQCNLLDYAGLYIPFLSNLDALAEHRQKIAAYLEHGGTVIIEGNGDSRIFPDAVWTPAPIDQDWWLTDKMNYPSTIENPQHPVFKNLSLPEANWHHHGIYTAIPDTAEVLQRGRKGEIVTWVDEKKLRGKVFATTQDCVVEMGVNQITHLDKYLDALVHWVTGVMPQGKYAPPQATLAV
ncbi:MAG: hypothetical protein IAF08_06340 [Rhizobacter sp.]|nr:hypothetical protein [Chlorobiales bacterium]